MKIAVYKQNGLEDRTRSVKLTVGSNSELTNSMEMTANYHCGTIASDSSENVETVHCPWPLSGRYVAAQALSSDPMAIGELAIYVKGVELKGQMPEFR